MKLVSNNSRRLAILLAALLMCACSVRAQIVDVSSGQPPQPAGAATPPGVTVRAAAGQMDIALQGFYMGSNGQSLLQTTGMAVSFKEYLPFIGLLDGAAEGYGSNGYRMGTTYLGLRQVPILGWHWDFVAGDFQFSANVVRNPFSNIYTPDIFARGANIVMKRTNTIIQFFGGEETLQGGPRIPFRLILPQRVLGFTFLQKVGKRLEFGVRFLNTMTSPSALTKDTNFFFAGRAFHTSNNLSFQTSYNITEHIKLFGEAGYGVATTFTASPSTPGTEPTPPTTPVVSAPLTQQPLSLVVGASWETERFTLRGNFVRESTTYLPLLGYFAGDREGLFVEGHYKVNTRIDVYGSASEYSNNLEHNAQLPTFHSSGVTAGGSIILPWKLNASASISTLHFTSKDPAQPNLGPSDNRQLNLTINRPVKHHNLRMSLIDMNLNFNNQPQTQRYTEFADDFSWKRLVIGGAFRIQNSATATETRNTFFYRGSIQANLKRISLYAYAEKGNDLANKSVFSTNAYSSTVAGMSAPIAKGWTMQVEAFRNRLNTALTAENVFLFPGQNLAQTQFPGFNQWSVYFRIGKHLQWGRELSANSGIEQYVAARVPLVGSVQGLVMEQSLAGLRPAANVAIVLDHYRTALTDATGRYEFKDVPEGQHDVGLDMEQLPTNYEQGAQPTAHVKVEPRALVRSDFSVVRLTFLTGKIDMPEGVQPDSIVIRLSGTERYTTPNADGSFGFYNLHEGEYTVTLDSETLPDDVMLISASSVQLKVTSAEQTSPVQFILKYKPPEEKPIRQMLQDRIRVPAPAAPPATPPEGGSQYNRGNGGSGTGGTRNRGAGAGSVPGARGAGGAGSARKAAPAAKPTPTPAASGAVAAPVSTGPVATTPATTPPTAGSTPPATGSTTTNSGSNTTSWRDR